MSTMFTYVPLVSDALSKFSAIFWVRIAWFNFFMLMLCVHSIKTCILIFLILFSWCVWGGGVGGSHVGMNKINLIVPYGWLCPNYQLRKEDFNCILLSICS